MATYAQVATYEKGAADGGLGLTKTNVMAIKFSTAVTGGRLTAWDDISRTSTSKEILNGTTEMGTGNNSWLRAGVTATDVTEGAGAGSLPSGFNTQVKTTTTFQLKGDARYVTFNAVSAGNQVRFVVAFYIPSDAGAGTTGHDPVFTCRYTYTGSAPTVTWQFNTGTEGSPTWTTWGSSYSGYGTGPNTTTTQLDPVTAPGTGVAFVDEFWVQTA